MITGNEILDKLLKILQVKTDKELSVKLGITQDRIYSWRKRNRIDIQDILPVLISEKIDTNELFGIKINPVVSEPSVDYTAVGTNDTVIKLAKSENEVAAARLEILKLQDELKKIDDETGIDNSKLKAILLEIDKLKVDKIKAEAERDILLDIIKGNYRQA